MPPKKNVKVYVATSGGVDSSVSAALLRDEGYDVTGVYFKTYKPDGDRTYCRQQGMDAKKVCEQLHIPFKTLDLQEDYKREVFDYMIREYTKGRTPNPDVMCNARIKFGIFMERARAEGADMIATGHYAQKRLAPDGTTWQLVTSVDDNKDQTYFLSQLSQDQLSHTLFPVGGFEKNEVRDRAEAYRLHTARKKDSQGICFVQHTINVKDFLRAYVPHTAGTVLNANGNTIGRHDGAALYTIGEHHGFTISPKYQTSNMERLFVMSKDIPANTITVGTKSELETYGHPMSICFDASNWIADAPTEGKLYACRIRHRGELHECTLTRDGDTAWCIQFKKPPFAPANGQFVAIYDNDVCLGGGVMQSE